MYIPKAKIPDAIAVHADDAGGLPPLASAEANLTPNSFLPHVSAARMPKLIKGMPVARALGVGEILPGPKDWQQVQATLADKSQSPRQRLEQCELWIHGLTLSSDRLGSFEGRVDPGQRLLRVVAAAVVSSDKALAKLGVEEFLPLLPMRMLSMKALDSLLDALIATKDVELISLALGYLEERILSDRRSKKQMNCEIEGGRYYTGDARSFDNRGLSFTGKGQLLTTNAIGVPIDYAGTVVDAVPTRLWHCLLPFCYLPGPGMPRCALRQGCPPLLEWQPI